jgi:hypothetical protein
MKAWHVAALVVVVGAAVAGWQLLEPGGSPAEPPARGETEQPIPPMLTGPGYVLHSSDPITAGALRLVFDGGGDRSRACRFGVGGGSQSALGNPVCFDLPAGLQGALAQATDDAPSALITRDRQLRRLDGFVVHEGPVREAFSSTPDHVLVRLVGAEEDTLVHVVDGSVQSSTPLSLPAATRVAQLVGDHVLVAVATDSGDLLQALPASAPSEPVDIGTGPVEVERFRGCRAGATLAVVAESPVSGDARPVAVMFRTQAGWTAPVLAETRIYATRLSCRGSEAALTWTETVRDADVDHHVVHQVRCTAERCDHIEARAQLTGADAIAVGLAGQILLVWASEGTTRGRLAPLTDLDRGVTLDFPDPPRPVLSRQVLARPGAALVLVRTADGTAGYQVDARGELTPVAALERAEAPGSP